MSGIHNIFETEKDFAVHMWTVGCIFCRPGISLFAVYFIYKSSVASETNMRNALNQIKFCAFRFYITYSIRSFQNGQVLKKGQVCIQLKHYL